MLSGTFIDGIPVFLFQCYKKKRFVITSVSACLLQTVSDFTTKFGIFYKSGQSDSICNICFTFKDTHKEIAPSSIRKKYEYRHFQSLCIRTIISWRY